MLELWRQLPIVAANAQIRLYAGYMLLLQVPRSGEYFRDLVDQLDNFMMIYQNKLLAYR